MEKEAFLPSRWIRAYPAWLCLGFLGQKKETMYNQENRERKNCTEVGGVQGEVRQ